LAERGRDGVLPTPPARPTAEASEQEEQ